jgi:hypothetical protein
VRMVYPSRDIDASAWVAAPWFQVHLCLALLSLYMMPKQLDHDSSIVSRAWKGASVARSIVWPADHGILRCTRNPGSCVFKQPQVVFPKLSIHTSPRGRTFTGAYMTNSSL